MEYNKELYKTDFHWKEGEYDVYRNVQWSGPGCHGGCGVLFYVRDGKVHHIEGDPNCEHNQGRLCMRCLNMVDEALNNPERLDSPLKRAGERGENKWERISWDEAYDIIEEQVRSIWEKYGSTSIVGVVGTGRNINWQVPLLTYGGFRSPNFSLSFLSGESCYLPRAVASTFTLGAQTVVDCGQFAAERYDHPDYVYPEVILNWGCNPVVSNADGFFGHWLIDCMKKGGSKLIVVDPRLTWMAAKADIWLQVRPGSDNAVALAMLNVIISEDLVDYDFVNNWCYGFDELKDAVADWTPERAAEIAWCKAEDIRDAALLYGKGKPSALHWGLATDMTTNGLPQAQSFMCLTAITGNVDVPGGNYLAVTPYRVATMFDVGYKEFISPEVNARRIINPAFPVQKSGLSPDWMLRTIETEDPYPIRMMYMAGTNPITNMGADAPRVYRALQKIPFIVVADMWMTPTILGCADLVLPVAMSCERSFIRGWWTPLIAAKQIVEHEGARSDERICIELLQRLNPEYFGEMDEEGLLDWLLKRSNAPYTFDELHQKQWDYVFEGYRRYETGGLRPDGQPGFMTTTGKFELSSTLLNALGKHAVTYFEEPPESPYSSPELYGEYPLVLTTGKRSWEFFHSEHRNMPTMREFHPDPLVDIHPDTAEKLGIKDGDWVWIENQRGRCRQRANVTITTDPRVVNAEHGWSFPEQAHEAPSLMGVFNSNINNLTTQMVTGEVGYGAPYKCLLCKVYKCTEENSENLPCDMVAATGRSL